MLRVTPLTDYQASKEAVLAQLPQAECIHFATHICWKTPAIVLSPGEVVCIPYLNIISLLTFSPPYSSLAY
jgi:hypothetical protein